MRLNYRERKREIMHKYIFEDIEEIEKQIQRLQEEAKKSKNKKRVKEIIKDLTELNAEKERRQIDFEKEYCNESEKEEETKIEKEITEKIFSEIGKRIRKLNQLEKESRIVTNLKQRKEILIKEQEVIEEFNEFTNKVWKNEEIWKNADEDFKKKLIRDRNDMINRQKLINVTIEMIEEEQYKSGEEKEERIQNQKEEYENYNHTKKLNPACIFCNSLRKEKDRDEKFNRFWERMKGKHKALLITDKAYEAFEEALEMRQILTDKHSWKIKERIMEVITCIQFSKLKEKEHSQEFKIRLQLFGETDKDKLLKGIDVDRMINETLEMFDITENFTKSKKMIKQEQKEKAEKIGEILEESKQPKEKQNKEKAINT